jgi:hypothetical protein
VPVWGAAPCSAVPALIQHLIHPNRLCSPLLLAVLRIASAACSWLLFSSSGGMPHNLRFDDTVVHMLHSDV